MRTGTTTTTGHYLLHSNNFDSLFYKQSIQQSGSRGTVASIKSILAIIIFLVLVFGEFPNTSSLRRLTSTSTTTQEEGQQFNATVASAALYLDQNGFLSLQPLQQNDEQSASQGLFLMTYQQNQSTMLSMETNDTNTGTTTATDTVDTTDTLPIPNKNIIFLLLSDPIHHVKSWWYQQNNHHDEDLKNLLTCFPTFYLFSERISRNMTTINCTLLAETVLVNRTAALYTDLEHRLYQQDEQNNQNSTTTTFSTTAFGNGTTTTTTTTTTIVNVQDNEKDNNKPVDEKLFIIRPHYFENDFKALQRMLNGTITLPTTTTTPSLTNPSFLKQSSSSSKAQQNSFFLFSTTATRSTPWLCRELCRPIQSYKHLIQDAMNLNLDAYMDAKSNLRHSCPREANRWDCPSTLTTTAHDSSSSSSTLLNHDYPIATPRILAVLG